MRFKMIVSGGDERAEKRAPPEATSGIPPKMLSADGRGPLGPLGPLLTTSVFGRADPDSASIFLYSEFFILTFFRVAVGVFKFLSFTALEQLYLEAEYGAAVAGFRHLYVEIFLLLDLNLWRRLK